MTTSPASYVLPDTTALRTLSPLRGDKEVSLSIPRNRIKSRSQAVTGVLSYVVSANVVTEVRANYSRLGVHGSYVLDDFGGSTIPAGGASSIFSGANGSFSFNLNGRSAALMTGNDVESTQRQLNLPGAVDIVNGKHTMSSARTIADCHQSSACARLRRARSLTVWARRSTEWPAGSALLRALARSVRSSTISLFTRRTNGERQSG